MENGSGDNRWRCVAWAPAGGREDTAAGRLQPGHHMSCYGDSALVQRM